MSNPVSEALVTLGRMVEGEGVLRGAIALADRNGLPLAGLRARNNLLPAVVDSAPEAMALLREGHDLSVRLGMSAFVPQFLVLLADTANRAGDGDEWFDEMATIEESEKLRPYYEALFAQVRAVHAALGGDLERAAAEAAKAVTAAAAMQSVMMAASAALTQAELAFFQGEWSRVVPLALAAAQNSNYVQEAAQWAAHAAVAGDLRDDLRAAIQVHRSSPLQGPITSAALAAAEAGLAAREGRWDEARAEARDIDVATGHEDWSDAETAAIAAIARARGEPRMAWKCIHRAHPAGPATVFNRAEERGQPCPRVSP